MIKKDCLNENCLTFEDKEVGIKIRYYYDNPGIIVVECNGQATYEIGLDNAIASLKKHRNLFTTVIAYLERNHSAINEPEQVESTV